MLSVIDYGLDLATVAQTNLLKVDKVQSNTMTIILHEIHARPPTNANQTESGAGQSILQCRRKSPQSTPCSHERYKGMQIGTGQVLVGQAEGSILQECQLTELKQKEQKGT